MKAGEVVVVVCAPEELDAKLVLEKEKIAMANAAFAEEFESDPETDEHDVPPHYVLDLVSAVPFNSFKIAHYFKVKEIYGTYKVRLMP